MFKLRFKDHYKVLYFTNEMSKYGYSNNNLFINELYESRSEQIGFVHIYDINKVNKLTAKNYPGSSDILALSDDNLEYLNEISFEIAVTHYPGFNDSVLRGKPLVFIFKNDEYPIIQRKLEKYKNIWARANKIVCSSYEELEQLRQSCPEYESKIAVIHDGVRPKEVESTIKPVKHRRTIFGFIGSSVTSMNLLDCMEVFKGIDGELRVACDTEDTDYFALVKDYIAGAKLQEKIKFYGRCYGQRKKNFLNSLDALIIPILYGSSNYLVLEAMCNKVPVICSNHNGILEITGSYKYCFDPFEPNDLHNCIRLFQEDSLDNVLQEVTALFSRIELFTSQKMVREYIKLFDNLLNIVFDNKVDVDKHSKLVV